jgi:hypothetical protein
MRSRSLCLTVLLLVQSARADDLAPRDAESDEIGGSALSATYCIVAVVPESGVCGAAGCCGWIVSLEQLPLLRDFP